MALTLAEVVRELEETRHQRAVWTEMIDFLSRFIDHECRKAEHGISAEGCVTNPVPQSVIKTFIEHIEDEEVEPLNQHIKELESLTFKETKNATDDSSAKSAGTKSKAQKAKGTVKGTTGKGVAKRGIRAVPRRPKGEAQGAS